MTGRVLLATDIAALAAIFGSVAWLLYSATRAVKTMWSVR